MKIILFCFIIFLVAPGCIKNINDAGTTTTEDFPNKVGDTWLYLVNDTTVNFQDSIAAEYNMTVSVIDSIQLPEGMANVWVYNYPEGPDTNYVFQTGDTIRFIDVNQTGYSLYSRQYIVPLILHNSWQYSALSINDVVVDSQANIIVGGNHFDNAFHISGNTGLPDAISSIDEWLENNVGVVKRYVNPFGQALPFGRHVIAWTLISFDLK